MANYIWRQGDTWVKVAWKELGEETRYRDIIEANPGYSPAKVPLVGTQIRIPPASVNQDATFDNDYYPWPTREQALNRLLDYNYMAILLKERINGPSWLSG